MKKRKWLQMLFVLSSNCTIGTDIKFKNKTKLDHHREQFSFFERKLKITKKKKTVFIQAADKERRETSKKKK